MPPVQHPAEQLALLHCDALHLPLKQSCPLGHAPQVMPLRPHTWEDCTVARTQMPARQHPLGQLPAVQTVETQVPF